MKVPSATLRALVRPSSSSLPFWTRRTLIDSTSRRRIDSSMIAANHRSYSRTPCTALKDEYGEMTDEGETFVCKNFVLENGIILKNAQLRYQTYGKLNDDKTNVIVVCHALTGNASLHSWWNGLLGPGKAFDTDKYFVVCCNILGSCYGSTSPLSINPASLEEDEPQMYGMDFPDVSVQDTVRFQLLMLQQHLEIKSIKAVIGGSFGGMQSIEYGVQAGSQSADFVAQDGSPFVRSIIPIACGSYHTAWQIAISEVQRQAIYADPMWKNNPLKATAGLAVARQMGMVSYRTPQGYHSKFSRNLHSPEECAKSWQVKSYLEYQGTKFLTRFDPITYVKMTEQMDSHDVARNRGGSVEQTLATVEIPARVLGIDSDILYPLAEQEEMTGHLPEGQLAVIHSIHGHDGFLLEQDQVANQIIDFLNEIK